MHVIPHQKLPRPDSTPNPTLLSTPFQIHHQFVPLKMEERAWPNGVEYVRSTFTYDLGMQRLSKGSHGAIVTSVGLFVHPETIAQATSSEYARRLLASYVSAHCSGYGLGRGV